MRTFYPFILTLALAACAPVTHRVEVDPQAMEAEARHQRALALQGQVADMSRLYRVSYPLLKSSLKFCKGNTRNVIGAWMLSRRQLGKLADAAASQGIGDAARVFVVVAGSPAERAGLKVGDQVTHLDGAPLPADDKLAERLATGEPLALQLRRRGEALTLTATPEPVCNYRVNLSEQTLINAFADGKQVSITRGMMRFAATDTELALVVAHEIAHNAMKHIDAQLGNRVMGSIFDVILAGLTRTPNMGAMANAAGQAYSQDFEAEADYVGLYIMARAGIPIKDAPLFWRRMASESPASIGNNHAASHPPTSYRMLALDKAVMEIEGKQAAGLPLAPRLKDAPQ